MSGQQQATPLDNLPAPASQTSQQDEKFVNNILEQMDNNVESEYNDSQQRYQDKQFGVNHQEVDQNMEQQRYDQQMMQQQMMQQQMMQQQMMQQNNEMQPVKEKSLTQKVKEEIKQPLIFLVLFVFFCIPQVTNVIKGQMDKFISSESLSLWGTILFAGVLGSVLFYVINRFV